MSELIRIENVSKQFNTKDWRGRKLKVNAVSGINLTIHKGETLGVVGESGSGKTTLGRMILNLETPSSGQIIYKNQVASKFKLRDRKKINHNMQIIFQDPYSALNPRMTALELVMEPLLGVSKSLAKQKAIETLAVVGISGQAVNKFPRSFSGGQRQRIGIARAIVNQPEFILCDEPTSALDVSIQSQIIELLKKLQQQSCLTYLFISHDLSVIKHVSDRIAVMYKGELVELGPTTSLFKNPQHPYTQKLLAAAPIADPELARLQLDEEKIDEVIHLSKDFEWQEIGDDHFVRIDK